MKPDLTPETIEAAQEWVGSKVVSDPDMKPAATALAALYELKLQVTIAKVVLAYRPKPKTTAAKRRVRKAKKAVRA